MAALLEQALNKVLLVLLSLSLFIATELPPTQASPRAMSFSSTSLVIGTLSSRAELESLPVPGLLDELELGLPSPEHTEDLTAKCSVPTDPHGTSRVSTRGSGQGS